MYVNISILQIKPGKEADFEASTHNSSSTISTAPGFIKRTLLKDNDKHGRYFYMSYWRSFEDIEAYRATEAVKALKRNMTAVDYLAFPNDQVGCAIIMEELAGGSGQ